MGRTGKKNCCVIGSNKARPSSATTNVLKARVKVGMMRKENMASTKMSMYCASSKDHLCVFKACSVRDMSKDVSRCVIDAAEETGERDRKNDFVERHLRRSRCMIDSDHSFGKGGDMGACDAGLANGA